jgi:hypothetical protein
VINSRPETRTSGANDQSHKMHGMYQIYSSWLHGVAVNLLLKVA